MWILRLSAKRPSAKQTECKDTNVKCQLCKKLWQPTNLELSSKRTKETKTCSYIERPYTKYYLVQLGSAGQSLNCTDLFQVENNLHPHQQNKYFGYFKT